MVVDRYYIIMVSAINLNSGQYSASSKLKFFDVRTEQWTIAPYGFGKYFFEHFPLYTFEAMC